MRKNIVAGNWKMNTTVPEGVELAKAVVAASAKVPADVGLVIATPFTHLWPVNEVVKGTRVALSAEN
ncbi:MAG: triose-phosphate isomerase, partial [Bacteroidales bacterium]|nr:triose-phosphate isomerase [Bacteroidales bacterium]